MPDLDRIFNAADMRDFARKRLPKGIFEFVDRGAEDDLAIENNIEAFRRVKLKPHMLVDVTERSAEVTLFGRKQRMPLAIAPAGAAGLLWYQGELEIARAAARAGIPYTLATRSMSSVEEIAQTVEGTHWFQLYMWRERALSWGLVERVNKAGFDALIVSLDVPVSPNREFNRRNGFTFPFSLNRRAVIDMLAHPRWLAGVMGKYAVTTGLPEYEKHPGIASNVTWDDIRELRRLWPRVLMVKGILRADDAERAVNLGVDGIIVSNHGGRCLDAAVATIDALPEIVDRVGTRATVLLDGGIRRGTDIVKALSLGASAVLSGRPPLFGLAAAGGAGAEKMLSILHQELLTAMGQVGSPTIAQLSSDLIARSPGLQGAAK